MTDDEAPDTQREATERNTPEEDALIPEEVKQRARARLYRDGGLIESTTSPGLVLTLGESTVETLARQYRIQRRISRSVFHGVVPEVPGPEMVFERAPACECGVKHTGGLHSDWCPISNG